MKRTWPSRASILVTTKRPIRRRGGLNDSVGEVARSPSACLVRVISLRLNRNRKRGFLGGSYRIARIKATRRESGTILHHPNPRGTVLDKRRRATRKVTPRTAQANAKPSPP